MKIVDLNTIDKNNVSPYFNSRGGHEINAIIIHSTESRNFNDTVAGFMHNTEKKSTHFIISREGVIKQLVDPDKVANHSGGYIKKPANFDAINEKFKASHNGQEIPVASHMIKGVVVPEAIPKSNINGDFNVNQRSIGIELMNADNNVESFTPAQLEALEGLVAALIIAYPNISIDNIYGHVDVSRDPNTADYGHTTYGHTSNASNHTDPKPNFPFQDVKEAIAALLHDTETSADANYMSPDGKEIHLSSDTNGYNDTPSNANTTDQYGNEINNDYGSQPSAEPNFNPIDANYVSPDGTGIHYGEDSNQADHLQQTHADANYSMPDGTALHYGADSHQTDHSPQNHSDSNVNIPDGGNVHYGPDSDQPDSSYQINPDPNLTLPDGSVFHIDPPNIHGDQSAQPSQGSYPSITDGGIQYLADSNQTNHSQQNNPGSNQINLGSITEFSDHKWHDPYHHAPITNHVNPFHVPVHHGSDNANQLDNSHHSNHSHFGAGSDMILPIGHYGADSNAPDQPHHGHSDANTNSPDGTTIHYGTDSNQTDHHSYSGHSDANASMPDGSTVHYGPDSNQADHSSANYMAHDSSMINDHQQQAHQPIHDDGSQSVQH